QQQGADGARALVESSMPFVRFQIERELERGDLTQAEGKDAVIAALKPAFATLAPSALREELLALVADRVDLAPSLVSSWLPAPGAGAPPLAGGSGRPNGNGGYDGGGGSGRGMSRRDEAPLPTSSDPAVGAERALLAYCVGMKEDGRETLSRLPDEAFTDELNRRAAAYLRDHWASPVHALDDEDDEPLRRLVIGLVAKADQSELSRAVLQSQLARVELAHLNRQIHAAKARRTGGVTELVARRAAIEQRLDQHLGERMEEGKPD
ncbi:MAG: dnaG, partial [Conexibacter sp.]|nr:dnaG [Conexibacter sp.]